MIIYELVQNKKGKYTMKNIYLVLTYTGTVLSKIITGYTKDEFSHVSISLDKDLNKMYSFGRTHLYNPFSGGFVHEYIDDGLYKRFSNTKAKIFSFAVTDDQFLRIQNKIERMENKKEEYKFNRLGMFAAGFQKKIKKRDKRYYCAEFIKEVLDNAEVETSLPRIVKPESFKKLEDTKEVYSGFLRNYSPQKVLVEVE